MAELSDSKEITINLLNEQMKAGEIAVFTQKDMTRYNEDLKKSYDDDEINSNEYREALLECHRMNKSVVTNEHGVKLFTVFIQKLNNESDKL